MGKKPKIIIGLLLTISLVTGIHAKTDKNRLPGLPEQPGFRGGWHIAGIDSDKDGIRDDVQRYIAGRYISEPAGSVAARYARGLQAKLAMLDGDRERAAVIAIVEADDSSYYLKQIDKESFGQIAAEIDSQTLNTKGRRDKIWRFNQLVTARAPAATGYAVGESQPPEDYSGY